MKRTFAVRDGKVVELTARQVEAIPQVMDDIQEFRSPDGAIIGGRKQWREHLKRTDSVEMGHADMKAAQENWQKRRAAFQAKIATAESKGVRPAEAPTEIREAERSQLTSEVMNRLHNRPAPDRKTLMQIAIREMRERRR